MHAGNKFNELADAFDPQVNGMRSHHPRKEEWRVAIAEALSWLGSNGLTATIHEQNYTYFVVTRKGLALDTDEAFKDFLKTTALRREALHPTLQAEAWLGRGLS